VRKCEYCGHENSEEASQCLQCRTQFIVPTKALREFQTSEHPVQIPISLHARLRLWAIAWGVAAAVMTVGEPRCWLAFWAFPLFTPFGFALAQLFGGKQNQEWIIFASGWLYYVVLSFWGLYARYRRRFFMVFIILCVSLLLNCAGCQVILHAKWHF